jgi:hypothetical protein
MTRAMVDVITIGVDRRGTTITTAGDRPVVTRIVLLTGAVADTRSEVVATVVVVAAAAEAAGTTIAVMTTGRVMMTAGTKLYWQLMVSSPRIM